MLEDAIAARPWVDAFGFASSIFDTDVSVIGMMSSMMSFVAEVSSDDAIFDRA